MRKIRMMEHLSLDGSIRLAILYELNDVKAAGGTGKSHT